MACIPLPKPNIPTLPDGVSIDIPDLPIVPFDVKYCCKVVTIPSPLPPGLLGPLVFTSEVIEAYNAAVNELNSTYIDLLPFECPRE